MASAKINSKAKMTATPKIILITGSTRGIGFAITQSTSLQYPQNTYLLGSRSLSSGQAALTTLRESGVVAKLDVVVLDVTDDESIIKAEEYVKRVWGSLDVLVNNAGIAIMPPNETLKEIRNSFSKTFETNVISVAVVTQAFLPLLRKSLDAKVINISSGRASLHNAALGKMPPTTAVAYSISKVALNGLTLEFQRSESGERGVKFFAVNPGFCKTAFNGYRGTRDPTEGAEIVVRLVGDEEGVWKGGRFLEFEEGVVREVPW